MRRASSSSRLDPLWTTPHPLTLPLGALGLLVDRALDPIRVGALVSLLVGAHGSDSRLRKFLSRHVPTSKVSKVDAAK